MMKLQLLSLSLLLLLPTEQGLAGENLVEIKSGGWTIRVADPTQEEPYYQGRRFALAGMVPYLEWRGNRFDGGLMDKRDPEAHDHVSGLADEFDIEGPTGYAESKPGQSFLKIGAGLMRRTDETPYSFAKVYEIVKRPTIRISRPGDHSIRFVETLDSEDGSSLYEMISEILFDDDTLTSRRTLKNTGATIIRSEFYGHHFLKIGDSPIGPNHSLEWPEQAVAGDLREKDSSIQLTDGGLSFTGVPRKSYYFHSAENADIPAGLPLVLSEKSSGVRLTIRSDQTLSRLAVWGTSRVLCPEPFISITLKPGESKTWSTTYSPEK